MNPLPACAPNRMNSTYSAQRARPAADISQRELSLNNQVEIVDLSSIAPAPAQNPVERRQPITERPQAAAPVKLDCSSSTNYTPSTLKTPDKLEDFWSKPGKGVSESDSSQDNSLPFLRSDGPLHFSMGFGLKLGLDGDVGYNFGPGLTLS